jgi:hypothetical protein
MFAIREFRVGDKAVCCLCQIQIDIEKRGALGVARLLPTLAEKNEPVCKRCLQAKDNQFALKYEEVALKDDQVENDYYGALRRQRVQTFEAAKQETLAARKQAKDASALWMEEAKRSIALHPDRLRLKQKEVSIIANMVLLLEREEVAAARVAGHLTTTETKDIESREMEAKRKADLATGEVVLLERSQPKLSPMHREQDVAPYQAAAKVHQEKLEAARLALKEAFAEREAIIQECREVKRARAQLGVEELDKAIAELERAQLATREQQTLLRKTGEAIAELEAHLLREMTSTNPKPRKGKPTDESN